MTKFVREFIQDNKNYISESDWYPLCRNFYSKADDEWNYSEGLFNEFVSVLETAGIPFLKESEDARKTAIDCVLTPRFNNFMTDNSDSILRDLIVFTIRTKLGLDKHEVGEIADKIAKSFNLIIDDNHYIKRG